MTRDLASAAALAATICVGMVFIIAALGKLRHRQLLPGVIANYRLLPDALVAPAAALLPIVELAVGIGLIAGERLVAPIGGITLLVLFSGAMAINIRRGRSHIDCGCGHAALRQPLGWALVWRNLLLAAVLVPLPMAGSVPDSAEAAVGIAAGLSLFLLYLIFNAVTAVPAARSGHSHI